MKDTEKCGSLIQGDYRREGSGLQASSRRCEAIDVVTPDQSGPSSDRALVRLLAAAFVTAQTDAAVDSGRGEQAAVVRQSDCLRHASRTSGELSPALKLWRLANGCLRGAPSGRLCLFRDRIARNAGVHGC